MEMMLVETSEDCFPRNQRRNIGAPWVTSSWTSKLERRLKSAAVVPQSPWTATWIRVVETDFA